MQQIELTLLGERDYAAIKGDTGPLWYGDKFPPVADCTVIQRDMYGYTLLSINSPQMGKISSSLKPYFYSYT